MRTGPQLSTTTVQMSQRSQPEPVSKTRFLAMLVSRQQFERVDDQKSGRRGLRDSAGNWFVISERELIEKHQLKPKVHFEV